MANYIDDTERHIETVKQMIDIIIAHLIIRKLYHDDSKLHEPEMSTFQLKELSEMTFGSEEYQENLKKIKDALDHHYEHNPHHPEHHENGTNDMTLIDVVEMFCDWKASTLRHKDGDIYKSIEICKNRFGISDQLAQILVNTAALF